MTPTHLTLHPKAVSGFGANETVEWIRRNKLDQFAVGMDIASQVNSHRYFIIVAGVEAV